MKKVETTLKDAYLIKLEKYEDERGFFIKSFNIKEHHYEARLQLPILLQDNHSRSFKGVLRGLHYQIKHPQGKLVRCINGIIFDVIVDLRKSSSTFGEWFGIKLDRPELQLWVPPGFAHGFYTLSETADVGYKTSDYYFADDDRTLLWNDPDIGIVWGNDGDPILSPKDKDGKSFKECDKYET